MPKRDVESRAAGGAVAELVGSAVVGEVSGGAAMSEVVTVVFGSEVVDETNEVAGMATVDVTDVATLLAMESGTGRRRCW